MDDELTNLIRGGPNRRFGMKSLVLSRFEDIRAARQLMHTWPDIAAALGLDRRRGKDLAGCFARVARQVEAGTLKVPARAAARNPGLIQQANRGSDNEPFDFEKFNIMKKE